jgi:hypothetical protein
VKHHSWQAAAYLFGQQRDEQGNPVKQPPGQLFRNLVAGALLGGAMGTQGPSAGSGAGGFLSGLARGGNAVQAQVYQRQQDAQALAQKKRQMPLEQQKFAEEKMQHQATLEQWGVENLTHAREADYRDREQLNKENEVDLNIQKWAVDQGAFVAPTIPNRAYKVMGRG